MEHNFPLDAHMDAPSDRQPTTAQQGTELRVPHWSEVALGAEQSTETEKDADTKLAPVPLGLGKQERERQLWMRSFESFKAQWIRRGKDGIGDNHPQQDWVTRQRKLVKNGKLPSWKRVLLDEIGFPYEASRKPRPTQDDLAPKAKKRPGPPKQEGSDQSERLRQVLERANATIRLGCPSQASILALEHEAGHYALTNFLSRCRLFDQAPRVRQTLGEQKIDIGYLVSLAALDERLVLTAADASSKRPSYDVFFDEQVGYTRDGLFCVKLYCGEAVVLELDYDYVLADQTHAGCVNSDLFEDLDSGSGLCRTVDWTAWVSGKRRRRMLLSPKTTANATFEKNFAALVKHLAASKDKHLIWSRDQYHYKFIEHMRLKARQDGMQFSHDDRLLGLHFTWGESKSTIQEVLSERELFTDRSVNW